MQLTVKYKKLVTSNCLNFLHGLTQDLQNVGVVQYLTAKNIAFK